MTKKTMYKTTIGDESSKTTSPFYAGTDTILRVEDTSFLPPAPNRVTLKKEDELYLVTLHYTAKSSTTLTVSQTPVQGKPNGALSGVFPIGSILSKPITQDDIQTLQDNIDDLYNSVSVSGETLQISLQ